MTPISSWQNANQRYLAIAFNRLRNQFQRYFAKTQGEQAEELAADLEIEELNEITRSLTPAPTLQILTAAFNLTSFERDVLLLCAGVELSASIAQLCAKVQGSSSLAYPTFSLALAVLPDTHWSALSPMRPLRRWRLIEVSNGESLTQSRLRIDERILHYLNGVFYFDDRLQGLIEKVSAGSLIPPSHQKLVQQVTKLWSQHNGSSRPIVQLFGRSSEGKAIAFAVCQSINAQLHLLRVVDIPANSAEREALARLWEREALLMNSVLLVDCHELDSSTLRPLLRFLTSVQTRIILSTHDPVTLGSRRAQLRLEVQAINHDEQQQIWKNLLGDRMTNLNGCFNALTAQFHLSPEAIEQVSQEAIAQTDMSDQVSEADDQQLSTTLWNACRVYARPRLDELAQRIPAIATWDDLILPEVQKQLLREIMAQVRQRVTVYDRWQFAVRGANGLGISALFAGSSGTGKTMAAEVIAQELQLDLYRIDLSQVVSKYIGETEKNLRRVFDAAETGGVILLFDEADALFGKRSEVRDSHDRYANIEVSYLLQRMEAYRGLAILTTNFKEAIDPAFMRRIRFVVQFPFPELEQRAEIWQRIFPKQLPTEGLDFFQLARLNVAGGNIRNIALNAAFLAADRGESVQMYHLLQAAQSEYTKLEKVLTEAEVGGWQ
ncbi:MAG: AAA family ATPase [Oculatellaceae cyanobacterium bins.114]|nr:AAA family ATPase [Oculatellaceae cyanobacterium bins.114]